MTAVVLVDDAEEQLGDIVAWWDDHRPKAPGLVFEELARCTRLLESSPDIGLRFHRTPVPGVRRLLMKRTSHHVYYVHDAEHAIVYIIAIWGAPKEGEPFLRDPRP
jgi:plasmid stabilization system protein ParE